MSTVSVFDEPAPIQLTPENSTDEENDQEKSIVMDMDLQDDEKENPLRDIDKEKPMTPLSMGSYSPALVPSPTITVASAVASDKARQRQIASAIEKHVARHGDNLYPSRDEKEKIAKQLGIDYIQVNRWFANRRRKQTKGRKIVGSSPVPPVVTPEHKESAEDERILEILSSEKSTMVAQTEEMRGEDVLCQEALASSEVAPPGTAATSAILAAIAQTQGQSLNPLMLASLLSSSPSLAPLLTQLLTNPQLLGHLQQQLLQQQLLAQVQQQQAVLLASQLSSPNRSANHSEASATWMSPPVSESPHDSVSDFSALSPRAASPRFKDPHNIADPTMNRLLRESDLTEKESIAIAVLTEMASRR